MGLDWVVEPKRIESNIDLSLLESKIENLSEEIGENWKSFLDTFGYEEPFVFPNEISDEFNELDGTKELRAELAKLQDEHSKYFVSPAQTINAPRLGEDKAAEKWVEDNWDHLNTVNDAGEQMTKHEYITKNFGLYIIEAAEESKGLGKVSGFLCSPTSFRGKVLGFVEWLSDDIRGRSYDSMEPGVLAEYGEELIIEAEFYEKNGTLDEDGKKDIELVKAAGEWCCFWAERGHSMHAWY